MLFVKNNLGIILTVIGMLVALVGQIISHTENNKLELAKSKLAKEIKFKTEENLKLNKQISKFTNDQEYFDGFDYSFIKKQFPDQSVSIFRQSNEGKVYKKSISDNSKLFENFTAKVNRLDKNLAELDIVNNGTMDSNGMRLENVRTPINIGFGKKYIGKMQRLRGQLGLYQNLKNPNQIKKSALYFLLVNIDSNGFTYAIGRAPIIINFK